MAEDSKFTKGNTGGRPPIFKTPQDMESRCAEYFMECVQFEEKPTITGLTLFVGFCSRSSWDDYEKRDGFSYIVKRAKLTVENSYEMSGKTFDMFALKNMGWKDTVHNDHTTNGDAMTPQIVFKKFNEQTDTDSE